MLRLRCVIAYSCLVVVLYVLFASSQDSVHTPSKQTELKLVRIGNGRTKGGVQSAFRDYEAPDGNKGHVTYIKFASLQAAQEQIENWVKVTPKITSREQNQTNEKGQLIGDRILGVQVLPEPDKKVFVTIRRDGLTCYLIESVSLQVATQIEDVIDHQ